MILINQLNNQNYKTPYENANYDYHDYKVTINYVVRNYDFY